MSWRESMTPASFRGVEFLTDSDERSGGRATTTHEVPLSNVQPYTDDLGIKGRTFKIDGYYVGPDCLDLRNDLLTALEKEGSGDLVHPTYGVRRVAVSDFSVRSTSKQGGLVTISMTFLETSTAPLFALDVLSPAGTVETTANAFRAAGLAEFLATYTVIPYSAELLGQVASLAQAIQQVMAVKALADSDAASLTRQVTDLAANAAALLASPATLVLSVRGIVASLAAGLRHVASGIDPLTALLSVYGFAPGDRPQTTTPEGLAAATSFDALTSLVHREVLDQAAGVAAVTSYAAYEDAVGARTQVTDLIDAYCEGPADETYDTMTGLRRAVCQAVPGPDSDLPRLTGVTLPGAVPSLVLSYSLYTDLTHEGGLLARNGVTDPAYMPGGTALEVLTK